MAAFAQLLMRGLHAALCLLGKQEGEPGAEERKGGWAPMTANPCPGEKHESVPGGPVT